MSNMLTPNETAAVLRCSLVTVYEMIHAGRLRALKLGRVYRVPEDAISELELNREREPAVA